MVFPKQGSRFFFPGVTEPKSRVLTEPPVSGSLGESLPPLRQPAPELGEGDHWLGRHLRGRRGIRALDP